MGAARSKNKTEPKKPWKVGLTKAMSEIDLRGDQCDDRLAWELCIGHLYIHNISNNCPQITCHFYSLLSLFVQHSNFFFTKLL